MSAEDQTVRAQMEKALAFHDLRPEEIDELVAIARAGWWDHEAARAFVGVKDAQVLGAWCRRAISRGHPIQRGFGVFADDIIAAKATMRGEGWRAGQRG